MENKRGGVRPGSGRPIKREEERAKSITFRLYLDEIDTLRKKASKAGKNMNRYLAELIMKA